MDLFKYHAQLVRILDQEVQRVGGWRYDSRQSKTLTQHLQKAQLFYILGDSQRALDECRKFNEREFSGDHRIWGNISSFLYLDARISRKAGKNQEWKNRMQRITAVSGNKLEWFETILPDRRSMVESYRDDPNPHWKIISRITLFRLLVEMIELRKYLKLKDAGFEKELSSTMAEIRDLAESLAADFPPKWKSSRSSN